MPKVNIRQRKNLPMPLEIIALQPGALQLRYLQTLTEVATENSSTVIFSVPVGSG